jgi:predicted nucleic acid-binding protein
VVQWSGRLEPSGIAFVVSAITVDEIVFGLQWRPSAAKMDWFARFMQRVNVLPVTESIARRAGEMRAQMAVLGQVREQADMLIAATAQIHALTLVTRNVRDFDGCGIAVLNPFTP